MPFSIAGPASAAIPSLDGINRAVDRLSSGVRTDYQNQAAEAAISGRLDTLNGESTVNIKNAINQISALQQADQTLQQGKELTQRIQELSVQSGNGTLSNTDRDVIANEVSGLLNDLDDLLDNAQFNGQNLFGDNTVNTEDVSNQIKELRNSSAVDPAAVDQLQSDLTGLQASAGAKLSGLSQQIEEELDARLSREFQQSQIADSDIASDVVNLIKERITFEASVKAFQTQKLAEASIINLLD